MFFENLCNSSYQTNEQHRTNTPYTKTTHSLYDVQIKQLLNNILSHIHAHSLNSNSSYQKKNQGKSESICVYLSKLRNCWSFWFMLSEKSLFEKSGPIIERTFHLLAQNGTLNLKLKLLNCALYHRLIFLWIWFFFSLHFCTTMYCFG